MFQIGLSADGRSCDGEVQDAAVVLENVAVGAVGAVEGHRMLIQCVTA
jgi:hypothetical protein